MIRLLFRLFFNLLLAVIAAALTVLVIVYWIPDIQKALLEHYLEQDPRRSYQIEHFQVQHNGIDLNGVFVLDGSNGLQLDKMRLDGNVARSAFRNHIKVTGGQIDGLFIDLSHIRQGEMIDVHNYLLSSSQDNREIWFGTQLQRALAVLPQNNWPYDIRDLNVEGSLLMEELYLQFSLQIEQATPEQISIKLQKFELH